MKKVLIMSFFIVSFSFADYQNVYENLVGVWVSPEEGELTTYLTFSTNGTFTIHFVPQFESEAVSKSQEGKALSKHLKDLYSHGSGYIKILTTNNNVNDQKIFAAHVEMSLNEELSTNDIDITENEIYIYVPQEEQTNKVLLATKKQK